MACELQKLTKLSLCGRIQSLSSKIFLGLLTFLMSFFLLQQLPEVTAETTPHPKPHYGGVLRLPSYGKPAPLDPFKLTDTISFPLLDLIFNKLIRWNERGEFEGELAKRWEISNDGRTYTFYLRDDVTFQNGDICTADDVLYTFHLFSNPGISPVYYRYFQDVEKWEKLSDFVFRIVLKKPFSPFLWHLWKVRIVPRHLLDPFTDSSLRKFIQQPIGTGPFKFLSPAGETMAFQAFNEYWGGRPYLNKVLIVPVPKEHVLASFLRGEVDMVFNLDWPNYKQIEGNPAFQGMQALSATGYFLVFNLKDPFFQDQRLRTAFDYAIDRNELIKVLEEGRGKPASGPFYPQSWAYNRKVRTFYDPEKAKEILHSAGFLETSEGLQKDGRKLSFETLIEKDNGHLYRMAKLIRQQLQEIGIRMEISFYSDFHELSTRVYQKKFQIFLSPFKTGPEPDIASEYWDSRSSFNPYANLRTYQNPLVDDLFEKGRGIYDRNLRTQTYNQIHQIIQHDKPALFLYFPFSFFAVQNNFHVPSDLFGSFFFLSPLKNVYEISNENSERG